MFAVTAAEIPAEGTANVIINRYYPSGDARASVIPDSGLHVYSKLSRAVYIISWIPEKFHQLL